MKNKSSWAVIFLLASFILCSYEGCNSDDRYLPKDPADPKAPQRYTPAPSTIPPNVPAGPRG